MSYLLALLLSWAAACGPALPLSDDPVVAITNVHVIPMDREQVLEDQTVLVRGSRIVAVGPAADVAVPDGATRIDGTGRYLIPGLAEMHGHLLPPSASAADVENVLFLYVANGITTVRVMLGFNNSLEIRAQSNGGTVLGPTFYMSGPSFNGNSVSSPDGAAAKVRQQHAEGWDVLKIHPGLTRAEYDAMARTAHEVGIRFGGHVPADVGLRHAIEMGQDTFDHLDGYIAYLDGEEGPLDPQALAEIVALTRAAGASVVPTMALWEYLYAAVPMAEVRGYSELKYMPPATVQTWLRNYENGFNNAQYDPVVSQRVVDNRMQLLQALHEGGVPILMGTDSPQIFSVPGFSLQRELDRMLAAGMSPYEVLRSGTYNVGEYFNGKDTFGTIAVGRRADLVLLNGNPLDDLAHLTDRAGVMVRGQWLSAEAIAERLAAIAASYAP